MCVAIRGWLVMNVCWCWGLVTVIWRLSLTHCRRVCLCMCVWVCKRGMSRVALCILPWVCSLSSVTSDDPPDCCALKGRQLCDALTRLAITHIHKREQTSYGFSYGRFCMLSEINKCICMCMFVHQCLWEDLHGQTGCVFPAFVLKLHKIMHMKQ